MSEKKDRYYLVPHGKETTQALGRGMFDGEVNLEVPCPDGVSRPGYEVSRANAEFAIDSRSGNPWLQFTAFVEDEEGIRVFTRNKVPVQKPVRPRSPKVDGMVAALQKVLSARPARL